MSIHPDKGRQYRQQGTQTGEEEATPAGSTEESKAPLIYVEVVSRKADVPAAVKKLLAQVREEHSSFPSQVVYRVPSDKGTEFVNADLEKYCANMGIRQTHTVGHDPSGNGAGELAVGFVKRKARHLLTGARLTTKWWGVAVLAAAHYSRCAAGLEEWPKLPFGSRAMVVQDPKSRNAFVPRSWPATVFGPSSRVPGGMIIYQHGRLKEAVNLQISTLQPEELAFVKVKLQDHDEPFAPSEPPPSTDWDAAQNGGKGGGLWPSL